VLSAGITDAGPWVRLPEAVAQLAVDPVNPVATAVVEATAASIQNEAQRGNLPAVAALMEAFASFVTRLPDGDLRTERVQREVAAALVAHGRERRAADLATAAAAWTLAASYDPSCAAPDLLREILVPPAGAKEGDIWRAPLDGAELVFFAAAQVRVGCSDNDRRCLENEVFFRWVEVPGTWLERHEVSNARYRSCVDAGGCTPPRDSTRFDDLELDAEPVVGVTWQQARSFAAWTGRSLPSEAVWERAARTGGSRWRFPWGNSYAPERANVWDEETGRGRGPQPVGSYPATGPGLFDLVGNVWEWCEDRYQPGLKQLPRDGSPTRDGFGRVVRGGSWRRSLDVARVSSRSWYDEGYAADDVGFRCAVRASEEIDDSRVLALAERSFRVSAEPGRELARAALSPEDRRYLERRAITWLLLEERLSDAVLQAVSLLSREPRDPVALDLIDRVEAEMTAAARVGDLDLFQALLTGFNRAAALEPRIARRRGGAVRAISEALLDCGETAERRGDRVLAAACYEAGARVSPTDERWRSLATSLGNTAGGVRTTATDGREMVWVPGGSYRVGASEGDRQAATFEYPPNVVTVRGFWIDRDEVTNADYRRCVDAGACTPPAQTQAFDDPNRASHPVLWVTWFQAREYARWAGKRLPSEAEWEIAARSGSTYRYPWGERWESSFANGIGVDGMDHWGAEAPVGSFPANSWGARDTLGNAAEWVEDVYHTNLAGLPDDGRPWEQETGPIAERQRVVRGGSYMDPGSKLRVSRRDSRRPTDFHRTTGFRCAAD
jgi:formylglycine-generating enzyme required for sulfatase activity